MRTGCSCGGGDGFVCRADPNDPDLVYSESQGGFIQRLHLKTGQRTFIRPEAAAGPAGAPVQLEHTVHPVRAQPQHLLQCRRIRVPVGEARQGTADHLAGDQPHQEGQRARLLPNRLRNAEVLWVGTDDGALCVTRDGGTKWTNISANVGLPGPRWVATIEPPALWTAGLTSPSTAIAPMTTSPTFM